MPLQSTLFVTLALLVSVSVGCTDDSDPATDAAVPEGDAGDSGSGNPDASPDADDGSDGTDGSDASQETGSEAASDARVDSELDGAAAEGGEAVQDAGGETDAAETDGGAAAWELLCDSFIAFGIETAEPLGCIPRTDEWREMCVEGHEAGCDAEVADAIACIEAVPAEAWYCEGDGDLTVTGACSAANRSLTECKNR